MPKTSSSELSSLSVSGLFYLGEHSGKPPLWRQHRMRSSFLSRTCAQLSISDNHAKPRRQSHRTIPPREAWNRQRRVLDKVVRGGLVVCVEEKGDVARLSTALRDGETELMTMAPKPRKTAISSALQLLEVLGASEPGEPGDLTRGLREVGHG